MQHWMMIGIKLDC